MKFGVVRLPRLQLRLRHASRPAGRLRPGHGHPLAQGPRPPGRRLRRPAGRLLLRRLPPLGGHRPLLPAHAGGPGDFAARGRAASSASATASRSSSSSASSPGPCSGTRTSSSSAGTSTSGSRTSGPDFTRAGQAGPGPAHPHRPFRRQLLRAPRRSCRELERNTAGRLPLLRRRRARDRGGQRQRLAAATSPASGNEARQRPRADAPPRTRLREASSAASTAG